MTTTLPTTPHPKRARPLAWLIGGLLVFGSLGGGWYWYQQKQVAEAASSPSVQTTTAQQGMISLSVSGPGKLAAAETRPVNASVSATATALPEVGQRINKGQLLTTLQSDTIADSLLKAQQNLSKAQTSLQSTRASQASSSSQRQNSVIQAQGNLQNAQQAVSEAQQTLNAQKQLFAVGAISRQELNNAQNSLNKAQTTLNNTHASLTTAQTQQQTGQKSDQENLKSAELAVQQAKSDLETAQRNQAKLKVYAPISGVITKVNVSMGSTVNSGATLLSIADDSVMHLPVQIDETEISGIQVGQTAQVTLDAIEDEPLRGKVLHLSPEAEEANGISVFTATVEVENTDGLLKSGMTAEAEILQEQARGLMIPTKAIQSTRRRSYVQIPAPADNEEGLKAGEPMRLRVKTGLSDGSNTIITDGLEAGQEVIVPGKSRKTTSSSSSRSQNQGPPGPGIGGPGRFP